LWCVFVFRRLVYQMLPVSLDCPFLIAPSVFSGRRYFILLQTSLIPIKFSEINIRKQRRGNQQWTQRNTTQKTMMLLI
jgi:hypothetical protein